MKEFYDTCKGCQKSIVNKKIYIVYNVIVASNIQLRCFVLKSILEDLDDYAMSKGYHLSASQIILLRPDLFKEFLETILHPEEVYYWFLLENELCYDCFEKYKIKVPEK